MPDVTLAADAAQKRGRLLQLTRQVLREDQEQFGRPWGLSAASISRYERGGAPEWVEDAVYGRLDRLGLARAYWHQLRADAGLPRDPDPRQLSGHVYTGRPRRRY